MVEKQSDCRAGVLAYTPCRVTECYLDEETYVEIPSPIGLFRLNGVGRFVWILCDGLHTVEQIVDQIAERWQVERDEALTKQVINLIKLLSERYVIVANWNPLYKSELSQEFYDA